jgi:hypothetical protein
MKMRRSDRMFSTESMSWTQQVITTVMALPRNRLTASRRVVAERATTTATLASV